MILKVDIPPTNDKEIQSSSSVIKRKSKELIFGSGVLIILILILVVFSVKNEITTTKLMESNSKLLAMMTSLNKHMTSNNEDMSFLKDDIAKVRADLDFLKGYVIYDPTGKVHCYLYYNSHYKPIFKINYILFKK